MKRTISFVLLLFCATLLASDGPRFLRLRGFRGLWVAPSWSPSDESTLYGWWKADSLTNGVNGSEVAFWTDSSGKSLHMRPLSTGSTTSPYFTNVFQNGLPAMYFDGVNDKLTNACGPSVDSASGTNVFFIVMLHRIPDAAKAVLFDAQRTPTDHEIQEFGITGANFNSSRMEDSDAGTGHAPLLGNNPGTNIITTYTLEYSGPSSKMWTNGVLVTTTGGPLNAFGLLDGMIVGCTREGDNWFRGYVMEMWCMTNTFALDPAVSGQTFVQQGTAYLRAKWGHY